MAINVKNLIAAISPEVYCKRDRGDDGVPLHEAVKKIVKTEGYLAAAAKAKIIDSEYLDIMHLRATKGAFELSGLRAPMEQHLLVYDDFSQNLEPIYFWVLDYVNDRYVKSEKLIDNFLSSPGSGHFAEMQGRATRMQDEAMKIFGTANTVIRSILNIIYDLKEFKLRLAHYDDLESKDERTRRAARLSLKQIWMDNVDIKRGNGSINGLAQQLDFVTIRDAFMAAESLKDVENLDLNDRVKRILLQRVAEFERWVKESKSELTKRSEIEKIYLKSQVNSLKLYARWVKPYLKAARQLEQNASADAGVVTAFNTAVFELVLLAEGKYDVAGDIAQGELPTNFSKMKLRKYIPITIVEFRFRSAPDRGDQRGGYGYRGRAEVIFSSFALNEDELKILKEKVAEDDFGDVYKMIEGATESSLGELNADLDEFLGDEDKKAKEKEKETDVNPFSSLFSFMKKGDNSEKSSLFSFGKGGKRDLSKGIPKDSNYELVVRSQVIMESRWVCRKLYDDYKKVHGMLAFPPVIE